MFAKPAVGSAITVTTDWTDYFKTFMSYVRVNRNYNTQVGIVVESDHKDDPASFRLLTKNSHFPVSVVALERVCELEHLDGVVAETTTLAALSDEETWLVEGSKGNQYVVTRKGNTYGCECQGFGFRKTCKHVNAAKQEVLDR